MSFKQHEEAKRIIYQVLLVHKGPILKFRLCCFTSCPDIYHWMHFLSKTNVQEITLYYQVWVGDIVEPVVQFLRAQSSSSGAVKLQRVQVNMFTGLEMEMQFMKFILASSPILEEIFIWNCKRFLFRSCKQMMDEMKEFRRASPNVEFTFEEIDMEGGSYEHEELVEVP
uniref:FBD domain-containing protein n=1 Tax=Solanum tuberosum TaxID=4113 RepID=M1CY70_SOLTU